LGTSFFHHVLDSWQDLQAQLDGAKGAKKFDLLFGYNHAIKEHTVWMHDMWVEKSLKYPAKRWKALLKKTNDELNIDAEITRLGIVCFLEQFKTAVVNIETYDEPAIEFNFH
jgi:hypothetical protein